MQMYAHTANCIHDFVLILQSFFLFSDVRGLMNKRHVQDGHEQVRQALMDYCIAAHPQIQVT